MKVSITTEKETMMTAHDVIATITKDMLSVLNNWQLAKLESSLAAALENVEMRVIEGGLPARC